MELEQIRQERTKWMTWKNIAPLREVLKQLPDADVKFTAGDTVVIESTDEIDSGQIDPYYLHAISCRWGL